MAIGHCQWSVGGGGGVGSDGTKVPWSVMVVLVVVMEEEG